MQTKTKKNDKATTVYQSPSIEREILLIRGHVNVIKRKLFMCDCKIEQIEIKTK